MELNGAHVASVNTILDVLKTCASAVTWRSYVPWRRQQLASHPAQREPVLDGPRRAIPLSVIHVVEVDRMSTRNCWRWLDFLNMFVAQSIERQIAPRNEPEIDRRHRRPPGGSTQRMETHADEIPTHTLKLISNFLDILRSSLTAKEWLRLHCSIIIIMA